MKRAVSPIISTVLLVAIAIAAAVALYTWSNSMVTSTTSSATANAGTIAMIPMKIEAVQLTTPYTWTVYVRNPNDTSVNLNSISSYLLDSSDNVCAKAAGFVADSNILKPNAVEAVTYYGWNHCTIPEQDKEWYIQLSGKMGASKAAVNISKDEMGLVLWMPMYSTDNLDWSGNGIEVHYYDEKYQGTLEGVHNGTLVNGPKWVDGKFGYGLEFNGTLQDVNVDSPIDPAGKAFTVSLWIKDFGQEGWKKIFMSRENKIAVFLYTSGEGSYISVRGMHNGTWTIFGETSPGTYDLNKWFFLTVVFDVNKPEIYVDGNRLTLSQETDENFDSGTTGWYIGSTTATETFAGIIDDVRIYDRALTSQEVKELYNGKDVRNGLVLYLPFNEGNGTVTYDWHNWPNEGVYLDGKDDYIQIPTTSGGPFDPDNLTIVMRTKIDGSWSGTAHIYQRSSGTYGLIYTSNGTTEHEIQMYVDTSNSGGSWQAAAVNLTPDELNKEITIAGTYDGNQIQLYIDGKLVATTPQTGAVDNGGTAAYIGASADVGPYFKGTIYSFRLYNRALTPNEIRCIYNNPSCLTEDKNLVVMYIFREPCRNGPNDLSTDKACKTPTISNELGYRVMEINGEQQWLWAKLPKISGEFSVVAVASEDVNDAPSTDSVITTRTPGNFSFDFKFVPSSGNIHGDIGTGQKWLTIGADVSAKCEIGHLYTITYNVMPTKWEAIANMTNAGGSYGSEGEPLLSDANHILIIGRQAGGGEALIGRIGAILILKNKTITPTTDEAICRLFKTC